MKKILLKKALAEKLSGTTQPVITEYDLGVMVYNLYLAGQHQGRPISYIRTNIATFRNLNTAIKNLLEDGILETFKKNKSVYKIFGKETFNEEEIVCSINPFAYISHLSAMEYHGLTDKISRVLIYSVPEVKKWRALAVQKMNHDYNGDIDKKLVPLRFIKLNKFGKKNLIQFSSIKAEIPIKIKNKSLRISSIGRTFLDMVRKPDLCGGIYNVLEAYEDFAEQYLNLILNEIDKNGNNVEKVRAGYILEERCGIENNPTIEKWKLSVQRGGSRKLDPNNTYTPIYSDSWCLSINIEE